MENVDRETVPTAKRQKLLQPSRPRWLRRRNAMYESTHQRTKASRDEHRSPVPDEPQQESTGDKHRGRQIPAENRIAHAIENMHDPVRHVQGAQHKSENQDQGSSNQQLSPSSRQNRANAFVAEQLLRSQAPARGKKGRNAAVLCQHRKYSENERQPEASPAVRESPDTSSPPRLPG